MSSDQKLTIRATDRGRLLEEAQELIGENTKAGAIDTALRHYIEDHRQKSNIVTDLDPEIADALSTNQLPSELYYEYNMGSESS